MASRVVGRPFGQEARAARSRQLCTLEWSTTWYSCSR